MINKIFLKHNYLSQKEAIQPKRDYFFILGTHLKNIMYEY